MRPSLANFAELAGRPVIIGAGAAGLMAALQLAPMPCVLVSAGPIGTTSTSPTSSSVLAQGGLAAAVGPDDNVALHLADTIAAGDGHCDAATAAHLIAAAPDAIERLLHLGARFDRDSASVSHTDGIFAGIALGLEAAHSRKRILHAGGDSSGAEVVRTLAAAVRAAPHVMLLEGFVASSILTSNGAVSGVVLAAADRAGILATGQIVLATGGVGGLYACTTNPLASIGAGIALAVRAGATVTDMEFVQFHPTALDMGSPAQTRPAPLLSEAVRGEGALLVNDRGERFLADTPGAELAARDVVARAIWRQQQAGQRVFLDARARPGAGFARRFPAIANLCATAGLDPSRNLLPVTPAAHYHMGGVAVDLHGRSTLAGLWACGEVACTGLHGANRLASNSLVEALVCGRLVAEDLLGLAGGASPQPHPARDTHSSISCAPMALGAIRALMSSHVGLERSAAGLRDAIAHLAPLAFDTSHPVATPALVGLLIAVSALRRQESRGAHCRADFPERAMQASRPQLGLAGLEADVASLAEGYPPPPVQTRPQPAPYNTRLAAMQDARDFSRKIAS